jgi:hypothetical protein
MPLFHEFAVQLLRCNSPILANAEPEHGWQLLCIEQRRRLLHCSTAEFLSHFVGEGANLLMAAHLEIILAVQLAGRDLHDLNCHRRSTLAQDVDPMSHQRAAKIFELSPLRLAALKVSL